MKIKNNFVKATAAAALTIAGVAVVNSVNTNSAAKVQAATMQVKINYVPGYGINIWTNFNHGHFTGKRAAHGTTWNVLATQKDAKGNTWYEVGQNEWIMAKYTVAASSRKAQTIAPKKRTYAPKKQAVAVPRRAARTTARRVSGNAASIIALAKAQAGKHYVWGATGPNAFDCSGLVQYVFKHAAGVSLPRTTYTQVNMGRTVSMNSLKPGDLLFWGSASAPYHVGIYIGGGQYVHAATPSQGVRVQSLSRYFYPSVAKRVLN